MITNVILFPNKYKLNANSATFNPEELLSWQQSPMGQLPPGQRPPVQQAPPMQQASMQQYDRYGNQVKTSQNILPQAYDWPGRSSFMKPLVEEPIPKPSFSSSFNPASVSKKDIPCKFGNSCNRGVDCLYDHSKPAKKITSRECYSEDCKIAIDVSYSSKVSIEYGDGADNVSYSSRPSIQDNDGIDYTEPHMLSCLKCKFAGKDMTRKELLEFAHMLVIKYYKPNTFKSSIKLLDLLITEKHDITTLIEQSFNSGNILVLPPSSFKPIKEQIQSDGKRTVWISRPGYPALINYEEVFIEDHINLDKLPKCKDGKDCKKITSVNIASRCLDVHEYGELLEILSKTLHSRLSELEEAIENYYFNLVSAHKSKKYAQNLKSKDVKYKTYCNPGPYALVLILQNFIEAEIPRKDRYIWPSEIIIIPDYVDLYNSTKLYEQTKFEYENIMKIVQSYDNTKVVDALSAIFVNLNNPTFKVLVGKKLKNILNYSYLMDVFALSIEQLTDVFSELFVDGEYDRAVEVFSAVDTDETEQTVEGFEEIAENLVQYLLNGVWENEDDEDDRFDPEDSEDAEDDRFDPDYHE